MSLAVVEQVFIPTSTQKLIEARQELMILHCQFNDLENNPEIIDSHIMKIQAKEAEINLLRQDTNFEYFEIHNPITISETPKKGFLSSFIQTFM